MKKLGPFVCKSQEALQGVQTEGGRLIDEHSPDFPECSQPLYSFQLLSRHFFVPNIHELERLLCRSDAYHNRETRRFNIQWEVARNAGFSPTQLLQNGARASLERTESGEMV